MPVLHAAQLSGESLNHTGELYSILLWELSPTHSNLTLHWESKRLRRTDKHYQKIYILK